MTDESFKNWTEGIRNLAIVASIIVGGAWAVYEFRALLQREKAQVDLELKEATVAAKWAEMGAPLNISINTELLPSSTNHRLLSVEVTIANPGKRGATLNIEDQPLRIALVEEKTDGSLEMGTISSVTKLKLRGKREQTESPGTVASVTHIVVLPGQEKTLPFLIGIKEPGVYLVEFRAYLHERDEEDWQKAGMPADRTKNWAASKYVHVG